MRAGIGIQSWPAPLLGMAVAVLVGAGCGGSSSPSTPSATPRPTPTPTPAAEAPTVIDGWNDQVLAVEAEPPTVFHGHGVVVRAPGYVPREQIYAGELLALWPGDPGYVRELVYEGWEFGDGSLRMVRWTAPFTLTLEGALAEDQAAIDKANEVAAELTRRTGQPVSVGPGGACRVRIEPAVADDNAAGRATLSFSSESIVGATVELIDRRELLGSRGANYRNTFLHEMGHVVGLGHSPMIQDVMTPADGPGTFLQEFREPEAIALHMMYVHRAAGNRPPDRDPGLGAASAGPPLTTVIQGCRPPLAARR